MNYGKMNIIVCDDNADLGKRSAADVAARLRRILDEQAKARLMVATGESQMTFLDTLASEPGIAWDRVVLFDVDDFWEPRMPERFTCAYQLTRQLCARVAPGEVHLVRFDAADPNAEAVRFATLIAEQGPLDIACLGIGTSGHLAFNEPGSTDFDDRATVRVVTICAQSKQQLRGDPNFKQLGYIPEKGITVTIPTLLSACHLYIMVPLALKRNIMTRLLATRQPTPALPASILSRVEGTLYVDQDSSPDHTSSE